MQPTEQSCDVKRIEDYLAGNLGVEQQAEFEAHLTGCECCTRTMEAQAAEQEVWDNARGLLAADQLMSRDGLSAEDTNHAGVQPGIAVVDLLAPTDDPEMLGRLSEYEISGVVGVGGMGAVLRGFDRSLRRVVAIKVMAPHLAGSGPARARFEREARAAAAITHDNIIDIYGVADANGLPYIVMPYARGPSLQKRIDRSGPLTALEVVRIGKQIASGLAAAHEQGLVHRDIKPANILLNEGIERLWITDFGVAHAMDDAAMTKTGVIAGTPQYMSPEQARGESVDCRSDLFSLGSVLYTASTGRVPFRSEAAYGILRRITDSDPKPIREINPDIPNWLCQIIGRLMAKHPSDRFQSAAEVADLFERCLAHMQQPTQVELPPTIAASNSPAGSLRSTKTEFATTGFNRRWPSWIRSAVRVLVAFLLLAAMVGVAWQATSPVDISGTWTGKHWSQVALSSVEEASGWYNGTFRDDQGRTGALQLEWSRLQRRYNGRWKSEDEQSGSITLRAGEQEQVKGAMSADPESVMPADKPRLREFSWRRVDSQAALSPVEDLPAWRKRVGEPQEIVIPTKGSIVRVGDGIRENAHVTKGQLIVVLELDEEERRRQLESVKAAAQQYVEESESNLLVRESQAETAQISLEAARQRAALFEKIQHEIVAGAEAAIEVEAQKVEARKATLAVLRAEVDEAQSQFDIASKVVKQGLISQQELQVKQSKLERAKAQLAEAEAGLRTAENEVLIMQRDRNTKRARAQVDIDEARASVRKAETAFSQALTERSKANSQVEKGKKQLAEIQIKIKQSERFNILAPADGYITRLQTNSGWPLKQGDVLCVFWPEAESSESSKKAD